ncbi:WW domain-containing protein [Colletotrichum higginsianum IMI 349063]|uniref:WW domain-containing protein n=2 Tax=Colletotrichum higginsianum TaxID=80884 RepID=A0A1B7Y4H5_COLHI|nr:WW domain-containing protein [Colletotrichum higginsianum IMI 349063]OBR06927.1 WW domain-containing protein [Colletotrichum higginsianum IMI 349063]TIC92891.1 Pre-mRNA-splicing factor dre4 [Colletotrichum higginsianum]GJC98944.1 WW domain-containing protein [Colletotrichum higginsianum]
MLRSTYKPSANAKGPPPLLPGWTEHDAPNGHKYYYNAETKESTYTRPSAPNVTAAQGYAPSAVSTSFFQYQTIPRLSDPNVANAYLAQYNAQNQPPPAQRGGFGHGGRGGRDGRPRPEPIDKPKSKTPIPGFEPWILVDTKYGRRFVYNPEKNASYWRIPEKLKAGILEVDKARIREKAGIQSAPTGGKEKEAKDSTPTAQPRPQQEAAAAPTYDDNDDSSEYEEVEVTDDEAEGDEAEDGHASKRQRTEDAADDAPVEFSEADIAFQLQAMGEAYGLDPGEYDDGNMDEWPEGAEGVEFSQEDAAALFRDLLDDFNINPYNTWEKLIEDGHIIEDPRYTLLNTMKARKETWQEWTKDRIRELKELRAKEEKKDPRIPYMALLQEKASPKLFWQEFKRKYRKEPAMTDPYVKDKDREKWYREHINRLKLPQATLKSDFATLLKSLPLSAMNNKTSLARLPPQLLVDIRYISLPPQVRDPMIEAYIQTLGPPPEGGASEEEDEATRKAREARERRERALREHEDKVAEQKRRQQRSLEMGRARLREGEREVELAMQVGKRGLQSQLASAQKKDQPDA